MYVNSYEFAIPKVSVSNAKSHLSPSAAKLNSTGTVPLEISYSSLIDELVAVPVLSINIFNVPCLNPVTLDNV